MKLLFLIPPMENWMRWGSKHVAANPLREERIENLDLQNWDALHSIMPTRHLSREELGQLSAWVNREFYRRPDRIERIRNGYTSPYVRMKFETCQGAAHLIDQ